MMAQETPPKVQRPQEVHHDETPSGVTDHPFEPKGEWYTLCGYRMSDGRMCNLAESAHDETTVGAAVRIRYYSDDNPDE